MICRKRVAFRSTWLCKSCYEEWPELRVSFRQWPTWAKQLASDHLAERRYERRALGIEDREDEELEGEGNQESATHPIILSFADAPEAEIIAYGEINDDALDNGLEAENPTSRGGPLRCVRCGTRFRDECPTFPAPPSLWLTPQCPTCGVSWYESA